MTPRKKLISLISFKGNRLICPECQKQAPKMITPKGFSVISYCLTCRKDKKNEH